MNQIIDARGKPCPLPVIEVKKAVEEKTEPGLLTVYVDNEIAAQNLLKLAGQKNLAAVSEKTGEREYTVAIDCPAPQGRPAGAGAADPGEPVLRQKGKPTGPSERERSATVVVLSSDRMGTGEDELGRTLMKAFVFALSRQDSLPETLLCYNRGAYLTCEGSESLPDLQALEEQGVEVLTCGTCLDYYGLKEKLAVGGVSDMYEIAKKMTEASSVIRP